MGIALCEPELDIETQNCLTDEITVSAMNLKCSGVVEVATPLLIQVPESHCEKKVEETTFKPPEVHDELIQSCPEYPKASEPQMMIGMHCSMHKHTTFESPIAPSLRPSSEESKILFDDQSQRNTESPDQV